MEKHDLIILDELGYVPFSKAGAELVSRAYERLSLIVTTNLPFEQWTEVMGSERLTAFTSSRPTAKATASRMPRNGAKDRRGDKSSR